MAIFDLRTSTQLAGILNIFKTLFVCFVLVCGAFFFTKDANNLVITPIEKILSKVRRLALNPMLAAEDTTKDFYDIQD